jgi:hypothetical protein
LILPVSYYDYRNYGYRLRTEGRLYLPTKKKISYLALDLLYLKAEYKDLEGSYYIPGDKTTYGSYTRNVEKEVLGMHTKFGLQPRIERFILDFYLGPGLRYVKINHKNVQLPEGARIDDHDWNWGNNLQTEGDDVKLSLSAGFKVGYILSY